MIYKHPTAHIIDSNIKEYTSVGENSKVFYSEIGKFCSVSWNVTIGAPNHTLHSISTHNFPFTTFWKLSDEFYIKKIKTYIGNDVWIGTNSVIISGVTIGDGVVIGANSVVTKDLDAYGVYGGNPVKLIKKRFDDEMINLLKKLEWWNLEKSLLKNNIYLFKKECITKKDIYYLMEQVK